MNLRFHLVALCNRIFSVDIKGKEDWGFMLNPIVIVA